MSGGSHGDATPPGVDVGWFGPDVPFEGVTTLVTIGLSNHHLVQPSGGLHQELLMHVRTWGYRPEMAAGVLFQVAGELIDRGQGLLRGEVRGPRNRLFDEGEMTGLVAASPVYLPDEFGTCETPAAPVILSWLVPITTGEARFALARGWLALEDVFLAEDPDLTDPLRAEVRLD